MSLASVALAFPTDPRALVIGITIILLSGIVTWLAYALLFPEMSPSDRLNYLTESADPNEDAGVVQAQRENPLLNLAVRLSQLATEDGSEDTATDELRTLLQHAGYKSRRAIDIFKGIRVGALFFIPVLMSPLVFVTEPTMALLGLLLGATAGYYIPVSILKSQAETRKGELLRSFPDALDLLVSSVESGLGLDAAFRRVALEMRAVSPTLSREFTLVNSEVSAGIERTVALKHLADRTGVEEIRSLVNMLAQAERYGSSIAGSMRIYSKVSREKRMSRAEEAAGQVGSKLTFGMIVFFLPCLVLVLLAPAFLQIASDFAG